MTNQCKIKDHAKWFIVGFASKRAAIEKFAFILVLIPKWIFLLRKNVLTTILLPKKEESKEIAKAGNRGSFEDWVI